MFVRIATSLALVAATFGQQPELRRTPSPLRHGGVYHVATGTWTRTGQTAHIGGDKIFTSTRPTNYFGTGWEGAEGIDEGILPSPTNPIPGPQEGYVVDGFEFSYCTLSNTIDWELRFFDSYVPCDLPDNPAGCIHQSGATISIPAAPGGTVNACWAITVDLSGGHELYMVADGGPCAPGYDGGGLGLDHFGWGHTWVTDNGAAAGPILAGYDPVWAPEGEDTCYLPGLTCPLGATGLGAQDLFAIQGGGLSGCFFFGGLPSGGCPGSVDPGAQFHLVMFTDCSTGFDPCAVPYCREGDDQLGELAVSTCALVGVPVLQATGLTGGSFAYHLVSDGSGVITDPPGGVGDLCLAGGPNGIGRYNLDAGAVVGGGFSTDLIHGVTGGGVGDLPWGGQLAAGQVWNFQTWVRVGGSSRFSPALTVTFEN